MGLRELANIWRRCVVQQDWRQPLCTALLYTQIQVGIHVLNGSAETCWVILNVGVPCCACPLHSATPRTAKTNSQCHHWGRAAAKPTVHAGLSIPILVSTFLPTVSGDLVSAHTMQPLCHCAFLPTCAVIMAKFIWPLHLMMQKCLQHLHNHLPHHYHLLWDLLQMLLRTAICATGAHSISTTCLTSTFDARIPQQSSLLPQLLCMQSSAIYIGDKGDWGAGEEHLQFTSGNMRHISQTFVQDGCCVGVGSCSLLIPWRAIHCVEYPQAKQQFFFCSSLHVSVQGHAPEKCIFTML